jgi:hypothetical protein
MSVQQRIRELIISEGITDVEFQTRIGKKNGYVNSIYKGIGAEVIEAILLNFSNWNFDFIFTGRG